MMHNMLIFFEVFGIVNATSHLDPKYTITYGNPKAPIHIIEYFSFGSALCVQTYAEDFEGLRSTYIDTGHVYWVFHPHPVDLLTVQAMAYLGVLNDHQKHIFLEAVLLEHHYFPEFCLLDLMRSAMEVLKIDVSEVMNGEALQSTPVFKAAFTYQQAKPEFSRTPTIAINGKLINEFPTRPLIDHLIQKTQ